MPSLDTSVVEATLQDALAGLMSVDRRSIPTKQVGKSRSAEAAAITKQLLHIDHLLSKARVQTMDLYWQVKEPSTTDPTGRANA